MYPQQPYPQPNQWAPHPAMNQYPAPPYYPQGHMGPPPQGFTQSNMPAPPPVMPYMPPQGYQYPVQPQPGHANPQVFRAIPPPPAPWNSPPQYNSSMPQYPQYPQATPPQYAPPATGMPGYMQQAPPQFQGYGGTLQGPPQAPPLAPSDFEKATLKATLEKVSAEEANQMMMATLALEWNSTSSAVNMIERDSRYMASPDLRTVKDWLANIEQLVKHPNVDNFVTFAVDQRDAWLNARAWAFRTASTMTRQR
jgi:hypothetical protein